MEERNVKYLSLSIALILAAAGCTGEVEVPEADVASATEVRAVAVQSTTLRPTLDLSGVLISIPENNAVLSAPVGGQVKSITVREGQTVRAGDPLVVLDTRIAESDLAKAKATLREVTATLALLRHGPAPQEIESARQEALSAAEAARSLQAKAVALQPLHERAEISNVQFDQAKSAAAGAEAASEAAAQRLQLLEAGTRPEALEEAGARVASAEADVTAGQLALSLSTIQSPLDGVVAELPVRLGMMVERPTVVARVVNLTSLYAQVRIPAACRNQVQPGSAAALQVTGSPDTDVTGTIAHIAVEADTLSGDVDAFVLIPNEGGSLQPGLSCTIQIFLPEIPEALIVPPGAVTNRNGESVVTAIREGKASEIVVETGVRTHDAVQIVHGLEVGDLVATEGGYGLPDDSSVHVTPEVN
jgi:multidrug efflux pump subunit AcrA (membrane-fusion protein)